MLPTTRRWINVGVQSLQSWRGLRKPTWLDIVILELSKRYAGSMSAQQVHLAKTTASQWQQHVFDQNDNKNDCHNDTYDQ